MVDVIVSEAEHLIAGTSASGFDGDRSAEFRGLLREGVLRLIGRSETAFPNPPLDPKGQVPGKGWSFCHRYPFLCAYPRWVTAREMPQSTAPFSTGPVESPTEQAVFVSSVK